MIKLSICITVFNQLDIVKQNITNLLQYKESDVEFIICDDCSNDNIREIIDGFCDNRIRYIRTQSNSGHDLNIIHALKNANGEYVVVFRSRDTFIVHKIYDVINLLNKENFAYCVFSAVDENNIPKLTFSDKIYKRGMQAIQSHHRLFVHPSGNIYRRSYLDIEKLDLTIRKSFNHKFGFSVHELIRMDLACKGDFYTSSIYAWYYPNTTLQKDKAVNSLNSGINPYAPSLQYERCLCQLSFVNSNINTNNKNKFLLNIHVILSFYKRIAYNFITINKDNKIHCHYDCQEINFNPDIERVIYRNFVKQYFSKNKSIYNIILIILLYLYTLKLVFYYPPRNYILNYIKKVRKI